MSRPRPTASRISWTSIWRASTRRTSQDRYRAGGPQQRVRGVERRTRRQWGGAPIQSGDHIQEDTNLPTVLFQTTISKLRDILYATGRDRNDTTLGILAAVNAATHDRRPALLKAGAQLDQIVNELNATVATDASTPSMLSALVTAAQGLQQTAPDLLDALHQAVVPMQVLVEQRAQLENMLTGGATTLGMTHTAFANQTDRMITIGKS